jgi:hypothetical protein
MALSAFFNYPWWKKCPFWPLCVVNFKHETRNTKKPGCDHYALKTYFDPKKL